MSRSRRIGAQRAQQSRSRRAPASSRRSRIRSGGAARAAASAAAPSATASTLDSARASRRATYSRMSALSSASRIAARRPRAGVAARRVVAGRAAVDARVARVDRRAASAAPPRRYGLAPRRRGRVRCGARRCGRPAGGPMPKRQRDRERGAPAELARRRGSSPPCSRPAPARARGRCRVPSCVRPRAPSTRWKRSKSARQLLRRDAGAGVAHARSSTLRPRRAQRHRDLALERELERVREQVEDDLLPHLAVDVDRLGERRAVDDEPQAGALDRRAEDARELGGERGEIGRLDSDACTRPASMREKSSSVLTSLQQPQRVAVHDLELARCGGGSSCRLGEQRPRAARASA